MESSLTLQAKNIAEQIFYVLPALQGDHIVPKNNYEKALCKQLGWKVYNNRYYDAFNGESFIEIKKGQNSMHFDMVRYGELLLGKGPAGTLTVFFRWKKKEKRIVEAYIIKTKELINFFRIDKEYAAMYAQVKTKVPRSVNILASATAKDMRNMACFRVTKQGIENVKDGRVFKIKDPHTKWLQTATPTFFTVQYDTVPTRETFSFCL